MAGWLAETERNRTRLERLEDVAVGQVSGAMGTGNTDPQVEAIACEILGLTPDTASTQVISRDRHADYVQTLALVGASLGFSTEIRNLQRTDVLEVEENFAKGQKGSSAMPHKRNPIAANGSAVQPGCCAATPYRSRKRCPLARTRHQPQLHRANDASRLLGHSALHAAGDDQRREGSRDLPREHAPKHECVWRRGVQPAGAARFGGYGMSREEAYRVVQRNAHTAWNTAGGDFRANLEADGDVTSRLSAAELADCFAALRRRTWA